MFIKRKAFPFQLSVSTTSYPEDTLTTTERVGKQWDLASFKTPQGEKPGKHFDLFTFRLRKWRFFKKILIQSLSCDSYLSSVIFKISFLKGWLTQKWHFCAFNIFNERNCLWIKMAIWGQREDYLLFPVLFIPTFRCQNMVIGRMKKRFQFSSSHVNFVLGMWKKPKSSL